MRTISRPRFLVLMQPYLLTVVSYLKFHNISFPGGENAHVTKFGFSEAMHKSNVRRKRNISEDIKEEEKKDNINRKD